MAGKAIVYLAAGTKSDFVPTFELKIISGSFQVHHSFVVHSFSISTSVPLSR